MGTLYSWVGHQDYRAILSDRPKECAMGALSIAVIIIESFLLLIIKEGRGNFESISADVKELKNRVIFSPVS